MNDIKDKFKINSYLINPYVLKNIKNIDITFDEFLLLIYFMNENKVLNLEDIKNKLSLSDEEILNSYSSLLNKSLIEIKMEKENGKISERIDIENFYNKIILSNSESKSVNNDIFSKFEKEFARGLTPIEYETINKWLSNNVSPETIESALKEAVLNGVTSLRYIDRIIYEWTKKGINNKRVLDDEEESEMFDYDWLGDDDE